MQQSDLTVRDLDGVILVGGPTRLSIVREAVAAYFQQEPRSDVDPDEVVAMGAAIHAASLVGEAQDSMLLDVTPLDLRIGVAGGLAEPVIERNTPVPIEQTRTFTTFQDHQESVQIRVYQGDHRLAEDNALLGQFEFSGFQKGRRADVKIDVTFEIDADGIVNVTASDQATGEAASTQITLSSGLGEEEIDKLIEDDVAGRVTTAGGQDLVAASPAPTPPARSIPSEDLSLDGDPGDELALDVDEDLTSLDQLGDLDSAGDGDLDMLEGEEMIDLTEESPAPGADPVSLDIPAEEGDDGFFDTSGADLAGPDPEIDGEER
jgi:hypothetical protein